MAAMMGLPVKFVFSHDSIGVGKNGPTHQPVEILASLRAMPNMLVLRPADAVEAAECWEIALEHRAGPVSMVFARQELPLLRSASEDENLSDALDEIAVDMQRDEEGDAARYWLRSRTRRRGALTPAGGGDFDRGRVDAVLGTIRDAGRCISRRGAAARRRAGGG